MQETMCQITYRETDNLREEGQKMINQFQKANVDFATQKKEKPIFATYKVYDLTLEQHSRITQ
jgi:hypothetical protein